MKKQIEVNEDQLKELAIKCCELGESLGIEPDEFAIMLSMVAKHLADAQGIEVHSARNIQA